MKHSGKRKKKSEAKKALERLWIATRLKALERDDNKCVICGSTNRTNVHHILEKKHYTEYKYDIDNLICLCPLHHAYGKLSAHKNGIWFFHWLLNNRPKQLNIALERIKKDIENQNV